MPVRVRPIGRQGRSVKSGQGSVVEDYVADLDDILGTERKYDTQLRATRFSAAVGRIKANRQLNQFAVRQRSV